MRSVFTSLARRLAFRTELKAILTLALVVGFLFYPWATSNATSFDSSDPRLVFVSPSLGGGAVFDQPDRQVNLLSNLSGAPRLDVVSSESSFSFQTDAEVLQQSVSPSTSWNWVSIETLHPWNALLFTASVQAAQGVSLDVAEIRVEEAANTSRVIFQTDFAGQSDAGWTLVNNATFQGEGSPLLPSLHLFATGPNLQSAHTTEPLPFNDSAPSVFVSALIRFQNGPGPFKVDLTWVGSNYVVIGEGATDWGNWSNFFSSPAPFVIKFWHPELQDEADLRFHAFDSVSGSIYFEISRLGVTEYNETVSGYRTDEQFHISATWERGVSLSMSIWNDSGLSFNWSSASSVGLNDLIGHSSVALSILPEGAGLTADDLFRGPVYIFPGNGRFADLAGNAVPAFLALAILATLVIIWLSEILKLVQRASRRFLNLKNATFRKLLITHGAALSLMTLGAFLYLVIALDYGGHPFDNIVFKTWIYSGNVDSLRGIYARSSSVGDSFVRGDGFPWSSLGFAYEPLAAYLMLLISKGLPSLTSFSTQSSMFGSASLEAAVKWILGLFTIASGGIIYRIVLTATTSRKRALIAMALFVFNPAIVFDSVIWGETDSVLYLGFLLFAILAARRPTLATIIFLLSLSIKQTGIILLLPTGFLFFLPGRVFRHQLASTGKASAVLFTTLLPLVIAGLLPSAFWKPLITKLGDIGLASGGGPAAISQDTYTVWTIFTPLFGTSGTSLLQYPSNGSLLGPLSFALLGYLSFAMTILAIFVLARKRLNNPPAAFWHGLVAFATLAFVALLTGAASRYYTLAIPGLTCALALGWGQLTPRLRNFLLCSLVSVSGIAFWTMAGLFTTIMTREFPNIRGLQLGQNPMMTLISQFYLAPLSVVLGSTLIVLSLIFSSILVVKLAEQTRIDSQRAVKPC